MREYDDREIAEEEEYEEAPAVRHKGSFLKKLIIFLLVTALLLFGVLQILIFRYIGKVTVREKGERRFEEANLRSDDIYNLLVIGSDSRDPDLRGRTDAMILLSIDKKHDRMTMTSFMRDSYVMLPEYDLDGDGNFYSEGDRCKLNAAYVYGGAELLMDTITYNFDIAVDSYIYIDFYSFIDMIDAVGGIELDIDEGEVEAINICIEAQNTLIDNPVGTDLLTSGGKKIKVNGNQALGFARMRSVGNADFQRTERQRTVISALFEKAKNSGLLELDKLASAVASHTVTDLSKWELYKMSYKLPFIVKYERKELRIPGQSEFSFGTGYDGSSVLSLDFEQIIGTLDREIYGG